jgi:VIT1/CCC1 family predicted Fe2+/Mn2+ transporter
MEAENRSLTDLFRDLATNTEDLVRKEIDLAKAEASEKLSDAAIAVGSVAAGVVLALAALLVLLQALVLGLTNAGIPAAWSSVIVGVAVAVLGYLLIHKGARDLKAANLAPKRTVRAVEKDAQTIKEHVQ